MKSLIEDNNPFKTMKKCIKLGFHSGNLSDRKFSFVLVETSNFSCAESNANEFKQRILLIHIMDSVHEKFDV